MATMSGRRQLGDEERALWIGFARSIKPLRRTEKSVCSAASAGDPAPAASKPHAAAPRAKLPAKMLPLAPLGRRLKRRVARGREQVDARIDLHGLTQSQAHAALLKFLENARIEGAKIVLIVTGKGADRSERDSA
ncbi:MAG: Smr/MutS family protein, partial [Pseudomonadota bacterium]